MNNKVDLKELDLVDPSSHWYYQSKLAGVRAILRDQLRSGSRIVDVGAGSGFFSIALSESVPDTTVVCVDPNYEHDSILDDGALTFVRQMEKPKADVYLFIDVLEHVDNDSELLRSYTDSAPEGAAVVISVPAFQSLWSPHDVFLEHRRRYRLKDVEELLESAGFSVTRSRYLFGSIFPAVWLMRRLANRRDPKSDLRPVNRVVNAVLTRCLSAENRYVSNKLFGLSAVVMGVNDGPVG